MKYKASLGVEEILITIFVSIVLECFIMLFIYRIVVATSGGELLFASAMIVVLLSSYALGYLYSPRFYTLDQNVLVIRRAIGDIKISMSEIKDVFIVNEESMTWTRIFGGSGGLFGTYGNFNTNFGIMTWYATQRKNYVLIETTGREKIILTPDDTGMVKEIRKMMGK